eukprot:TRINITY_DN28507_c0_g1_i1.p1 TRINITY_DN28507_c0_g1~~TRINITY_DN28507_c0_g1_i1.p1  ORF type:complete len:361 (-),score=62.64 TRINITY_DN28507_c0_g1_i1:429-1511(-)
MAGRRASVAAVLGSSLSLVEANDKCKCLFQGKTLPEDIYTKYPDSDKGKYKDLDGIKFYGTTCGAWDQMPGMPWSSSCVLAAGASWKDKKYNWCQVPWCYVDKDCPGAMASSVFKGSTAAAYYAYSPCGDAKDCFTSVYNNGAYDGAWASGSGCPYDPSGNGDYQLSQGGDCECIFQGKQLDTDIYTNYPDKNPAGCTAGSSGECKTYPGMYKDLKGTKYYGSACVAWDQQPETPWYSYCPADADWCHYDYNWCVAPWCYVDKKCKTGVATSTFNGTNDVAFFSYDTCLKTPDCLTHVAWKDEPKSPEKCPFDSATNKWDTPATCTSGWTKASSVISGALRVDAKMAGVAMMMALLANIM